MEHMICFQACNLPLLECRGCECRTGRAPEKQVDRLSHPHRAGFRSVLVLQLPISVFLFICKPGSIIMVSLHNCSKISLGTSVAILRLCHNKATRDTRYSQNRKDCKKSKLLPLYFSPKMCQPECAYYRTPQMLHSFTHL